MPSRDEIAAAVAAYEQANPFTPLPRNATLLLAAMFPTDDICRLSLDAIAALGFGRRQLPTTLQRLTRAGFLSWEPGGGGPVSNTYHLHIPPVRR